MRSGAASVRGPDPWRVGAGVDAAGRRRPVGCRLATRRHADEFPEGRSQVGRTDLHNNNNNKFNYSS